MSTIPRWVILIKVLYDKSKHGLFITNEQLAKIMPAGYCARNELAQSGVLESRYGIELLRYRPDGKLYKQYSIKPECLPLAHEILAKFKLV